jgi:hypothetical protein
MERIIVFRPGRTPLHVALVRLGGARRRRIARRMAEAGMTEPAIALALKVTRASVPGLIRGQDRGFDMLRQAMREAADRAATGLPA